MLGCRMNAAASTCKGIALQFDIIVACRRVIVNGSPDGLDWYHRCAIKLYELPGFNCHICRLP